MADGNFNLPQRFGRVYIMDYLLTLSLNLTHFSWVQVGMQHSFHILKSPLSGIKDKELSPSSGKIEASIVQPSNA